MRGIIKQCQGLKGVMKPQEENLCGVMSRTVESVVRQSKEITITENGTVDVLPDANKVLEKVTIVTDVIGANAEEYKGSYEVVPSAREQVLSTALKVMRNDVKIKEIPYKETPNSSGRGTTVRIG